ncbi:MAG: hypothetical protein FVQ77_13315 [Cytophagales bacterium]|nr:hypothetical protein [Cytophagales bacterium]
MQEKSAIYNPQSAKNNCRLLPSTRDGLPIVDCRLPIVDCRLPTADCRLWTANCQLSTDLSTSATFSAASFSRIAE